MIFFLAHLKLQIISMIGIENQSPAAKNIINVTLYEKTKLKLEILLLHFHTYFKKEKNRDFKHVSYR